ncbi:MFS transporter [Nocardia sp. bgisy118]|uniref:MFS transporter n=1 Tax=Nocardia sp. bgisy118 TaxID=3413786 RepID=UPI003F4A1EB4
MPAGADHEREFLGLDPAVVVPLVACPISAALWLWYETRVSNPVVDLATSLRRQVLLTNIAAVLAGFAMFTQNMLTPRLLQADENTGYGLGSSAFVAGLALAPAGFMMMVLSPAASRLSTRHGPKTTLLAGLVITAFGYATAALMTPGVWQLAVVAGVNGAGVGLAYSAMPALVMNAVPESETAAATGLNTLMRTIGTSSSSAVLAMLLTTVTIDTAAGAAPAESAFHLGFGMGAASALAALFVAAFLRTGNRNDGGARIGAGLAERRIGAVLAER